VPRYTGPLRTEELHMAKDSPEWCREAPPVHQHLPRRSRKRGLVDRCSPVMKVTSRAVDFGLAAINRNGGR
jgi:hypothetical protein